MRTPQFKVAFPASDRAKLRKLAQLAKLPEAEIVRLFVRKQLADPRAVALLAVEVQSPAADLQSPNISMEMPRSE